MRRLSALLLALLPAPAWANAGIGFLMPSIPALLVALVPVIFVEAPILGILLRLHWRRALKLSAAVNLISTLAGFGLAVVIDLGLMILLDGSSGPLPSRASLLGALVPMFFITWWIEKRSVAKRVPEAAGQRLLLATLAANAVSYAALAAAIAWTPAFHNYDQMGYREHVYSAASAAYVWKEGIEKHWQTHRRFPEREADLALERPAARRGVRSITLQHEGRFVIELDFPHAPELDRRRLIYEPGVAGDKLEWLCRAPELEQRYAPYGCKGEGR